MDSGLQDQNRGVFRKVMGGHGFTTLNAFFLNEIIKRGIVSLVVIKELLPSD
jgi:hypothetical protein